MVPVVALPIYACGVGEKSALQGAFSAFAPIQDWANVRPVTLRWKRCYRCSASTRAA